MFLSCHFVCFVVANEWSISILVVDQTAQLKPFSPLRPVAVHEDTPAGQVLPGQDRPDHESVIAFGIRYMAWERKVTGGILAAIGFMLSPLSWWNDLFVNVPLALVFAWAVSYFYKPAFEWCVIVGYWLTNVLGLVLMQKGGERVFSKADKPYSRRALLRDLGISLLYTGLIVLLLKCGVLKPIQHYFEG